jgi:predicted GH43/DUF377 family glycosyl hydrolase
VNDKDAMEHRIVDVETSLNRLGTIIEPEGRPEDAGGVLNPAVARARDGRLLVYPRAVEKGNISRIGIVAATERGEETSFERLGFALEPEAPYEKRIGPGGYGCEDPRVTFVPALDAYVMLYTAFGPEGPRIAFALSPDGYRWERLGLANFSRPGLHSGDDKDGAFFPEPVRSPSGQRCFAFYHRPMLHISTFDGHAAVPHILAMPAADRESIRIAYIPLEPALADRRKLLDVAESVIVASPEFPWDCVKTGGGTPPVRTESGWMSLYHGVSAKCDDDGVFRLTYSAGLLIHDLERPHIVRYRSPQPVMVPVGEHETVGVVNNVVFPTGIDRRPGAPPDEYDVYYGMADSRIGRARMVIGEIVEAESAA